MNKCQKEYGNFWIECVTDRSQNISNKDFEIINENPKATEQV